ncbi:MAG: rhodanese-like domain-containing protein [Bacteroidetes bacterium]|nr:rhodanese-like domain-containing protein [Bacteroidota bacterium]
MEELLNNQNVTLVDVRSCEEFEEETIKGALNIPLHTVPTRLDEFKSMKTPIIVFCRSGARSNQATTYLKNQGIEVFDGGGIGSLKTIINRN